MLFTSTAKEFVFNIFNEVWQAHHSFPDIGTILVTGAEGVLTFIFKPSLVFQLPSEIKKNYY